MGFPERASAELGQKLVEDTVSSITDKVKELESKADGVYKEVRFTPEPNNPVIKIILSHGQIVQATV